MRSTQRSVRIFLDNTPTDGQLALAPEEAHYLATVLRLRTGDAVTAFNGRGMEWNTRVTGLTRRAGLLEVVDTVQPLAESELELTLVQAIVKSEAMDTIVQKATELGVKRITPVLTEYGVVKLDEARAEKKRDHWQSVAASACEQCGRVRLPLIDAPLPLKHWFGNKAERVDTELILQPGAATPLTGIEAPKTKVCVLIGPEGGFSDGELEDADVAGFRPVSLGPRVLRTETAAVATLAILQSLWGDLR